MRQPLTLFPAEEEERHYRKERLVVPAEEVQGFRVSGVDRSPDVGHMAHLAPTSFKREEGLPPSNGRRATKRTKTHEGC